MLTFTGRPALFTDQYCLTMAQSLWRRGLGEEAASFEMFVRTVPEPFDHLVAAGLGPVLDYLDNLHFTDEDLDELRDLGTLAGLGDDFVEYLRGLRFTGHVDAVPEGTRLPAQAPLLRITAPRVQATLVESAVLTLLNHQTLIATKAARIVEAAAGVPVFDNSLRRLYGPDSALGVARATYLAGFAGTATVAAGTALGIPTTGTMAHQYVMGYGPDAEQRAFEHFLEDNPTNGVLLVDTYEPVQGIRNAIAATAATGIPLKAIRLDSGDLGGLAVTARELLDGAGLDETRILASNDLDEHALALLTAAGAPIDGYGIGTKVGVPAEGPLGGVYKLVALHHDEGEQIFMKLSEGKATDPGCHQLWRDPLTGAVTLAMADEPVPDGHVALMERVTGAPRPTLDEARAQAADERLLPPPGALRRSARLWAERARLGDQTTPEPVLA